MGTEIIVAGFSLAGTLFGSNDSEQVDYISNRATGEESRKT